MAQLTYDGTRFVFECAFEEREIPRLAGMQWSQNQKEWWTTDLAVAVKLRNFATGAAKTKISQTQIEYFPWQKPLPLPPAGLELRDFQKEAALYALGQSRAYLGMKPGLGKTIVAATVAQALAPAPVVYVSPPFLVQNVEEEFRKWAPALSVTTYGVDYDPTAGNVLVVPDTALTHSELPRHLLRFAKPGGAALIVDEAHRFKNTTAKRTAALFGVTPIFSRRVYMSGTPMPNRPMELYPVLSREAPATIDYMNEFQYGRKYCAGFKGNWGWDFTGASNVPELRQKVVGPFMLRMDIALLKLPPLLEEVFVVSANMSPRLAKLDKGLGDAYSTIDDLIKEELAATVGKDEHELHTATYRKLLGMEKVAPVARYLESLLEETDEAILVFAYHKEVIAELAFFMEKAKPLVITGETPTKDRQAIVKTFQEDKRRRLFIGNYIAAGIGFTMTKAKRVVFLEYSWVPGENDQAAARAHRMGQNSSVLVQYVSYKDSIDKLVIEALLKKRKATEYI